MRLRRSAVLVLMSVMALYWVGSVRRADAKPRTPRYAPVIDPANFQLGVDHPYYPLVPGTSFKFVEKEGRATRDVEVTVLHETKVIQEVTCVVVHDRVSENGKVLEDTFDWYAQDKQGNVWYFGEHTEELLPGGEVDASGSWETGVDGAKPGIIMPAQVVPGEPYRQEYYAGEAEDMGQIAAVNESVSVPYGSFDGCVQIKEWSQLEAGTSRKWYAKGIGFVRSVSSSKEIATLVAVTRP